MTTLERFQERVKAAQTWPHRSTLVFANQEAHWRLLSDVYRALTGLALPDGSSDVCVSERGDGLIVEHFIGNYGLQVETWSYSLLVGDDICMLTGDRDDENCPPPPTVEVVVLARSREALERAASALCHWHAARGVPLRDRR